MQQLLWVLMLFGAALIVVGIIALIAGIVLARPTAESDNETEQEPSVWVIITERLLGWFDRLISLLLSDDAPRAKRLRALGILLILLGVLCLGGALYAVAAGAGA